MAYVARHLGRVKEGQVVLVDPAAWRAAVARHEGRDVYVTVRRVQHSRTLSQNAYYWSCIVAEIASYIGESDAATHELLKVKFLPMRHVELLDGQQLDMPPSTRLLTVEEFSAYVESVKRWAAEWLHLSLPDAGQVEVAL